MVLTENAEQPTPARAPRRSGFRTRHENAAPACSTKHRLGKKLPTQSIELVNHQTSNNHREIRRPEAAQDTMTISGTRRFNTCCLGGRIIAPKAIGLEHRVREFQFCQCCCQRVSNRDLNQVPQLYCHGVRGQKIRLRPFRCGA